MTKVQVLLFPAVYDVCIQHICNFTSLPFSHLTQLWTVIQLRSCHRLSWLLLEKSHQACRSPRSHGYDKLNCRNSHEGSEDEENNTCSSTNVAPKYVEKYVEAQPNEPSDCIVIHAGEGGDISLDPIELRGLI